MPEEDYSWLTKRHHIILQELFDIRERNEFYNTLEFRLLMARKGMKEDELDRLVSELASEGLMRNDYTGIGHNGEFHSLDGGYSLEDNGIRVCRFHKTRWKRTIGKIVIQIICTVIGLLIVSLILYKCGLKN